MRRELLEILRCPFCGGRLGLVETGLLHKQGDEILDGILGCHCCAFPVVDGIPVLHLDESATSARAHLDAGRPDLARRALFGLVGDGDAERFDALAASPTTTYREIVEALGPHFEGGYFLYRFTDPTYLVAQAVVRSVAATVLEGGGRAVDLCGGSGHLTRVLLDLSTPPPVLADLYFSKVWLGRRFTAPGCEGVCCDGNAPLPFARGSFRFAVCSDAYHYIWTKRLFASEMLRVIDGGDARTAAVVSHTHNADQWNPSAGMPLPPSAYRDLFADLPNRLFGESALLAGVINDGAVDLSRGHSDEALGTEPALTLIASRAAGVFASHVLAAPATAVGTFQVNPLYTTAPDGDRVRLVRCFPSSEYEDEYGACRQYLPAAVAASRADLDLLPSRTLPSPLLDLARQRVVVDLPVGYR